MKSPASLFDKYYSVSSVAYHLEMSKVWVLRRLKEGAFGSGVLDLDGDLRIPVSGLNAFLESHRRVYSEAISARNKAELRRKLAGRAAAAPGDEAGFVPVLAEGVPVELEEDAQG